MISATTLVWSGLILVYGLLVAIGGIMGYTKARSKVSLISGLGSGLLLAIAAYITLNAPASGLQMATLIAGLLLVIFGVRFSKTRTFMPAGLMTILSLIATIAFAFGWLQLAS